jgi:hypothetical protein
MGEISTPARACAVCGEQVEDGGCPTARVCINCWNRYLEAIDRKEALWLRPIFLRGDRPGFRCEWCNLRLDAEAAASHARTEHADLIRLEFKITDDMARKESIDDSVPYVQNFIDRSKGSTSAPGMGKRHGQRGRRRRSP